MRHMQILTVFIVSMLASSFTMATAPKAPARPLSPIPPCYYIDPDHPLIYDYASSNQINMQNLPRLDRAFLAQTKGGLPRAVGAVELAALVRLVAVKHIKIQLTQDELKRWAREEMLEEIDRLKLPKDRNFELVSGYLKDGSIPLDELDQILTNIKRDFVGVRGYNGCTK